MTYNEIKICEIKEILKQKGINADVKMTDDFSVEIVFNNETKIFNNAKMAKIFVEKYEINSIIKLDSRTSGIIGQNTVEIIKKQRGRPRKTDNDRRKLPQLHTSSI